MSTDLSLYQVDLDTAQANGRSGESPRSAFTKYNELVDILEGWNNTYISDSAPSPTYAFQQWIDTSTDPATIKMRDSSDSSWVSLGSYNQSFGTAAGYDASTTSTGGYIPVADSSGKLDEAWIDYTSHSVTLTGEVEGTATFDSTGSVSVDTTLDTASLATALSGVYTETPSLSIPFNESGKLDYGVGTEYVSGLPIYGVDFTRSTTSTVINKSGVLETLAADEIGIGADGVWLHGSYTNLIDYSEDISQSTWTKINGALINGTNGIVKVASNSKIRESSSLGTVEVGDKISVQLMAKPGASNVLSLYTFYAVGSSGGYNTLIDLDSKTVTQQGSGVDYLSIESMVDDWVYIEALLSVTHDTFTEILLDFTAGDGSYVGDGSTTDVFVSNVQLINGETALPYLPTSGTTASATATSCTVPVDGNLPAKGESFTICMDVFYTSSDGKNRGLLFTEGLRNYISTAGVFSVITSEGNIGLKSVINNSVNRLVLVVDYENGIIKGYVNGVVGSNTATITALELDYEGVIQLGFIPNSQYLNSQMKNFKVLPYAASADEVKSWGAPK